MTADVPTYLDGNAAAGALREMFAVDITAAIAQCAGCGAHRGVRRGAVCTSTPPAWSPAAPTATPSCSAS